jgi:hypothetical protein
LDTSSRIGSNARFATLRFPIADPYTLFESFGLAGMHEDESSTEPVAHFSDVWANAQTSRSVSLGSLVLRALRRIFRGAGTERSARDAHHSAGT